MRSTVWRKGWGEIKIHTFIIHTSVKDLYCMAE